MVMVAPLLLSSYAYTSPVLVVSVMVMVVAFLLSSYAFPCIPAYLGGVCDGDGGVSSSLAVCTWKPRPGLSAPKHLSVLNINKMGFNLKIYIYITY